MTHLLYLSILFFTMSTQTIFDFNKKSDLKNWRVVDDTVMGGVSAGNFKLNDDGHAEFYGHVSLDYNGGFSSVRYRSEKVKTEGYSKVILKIKGDGERYQFRLKSEAKNYYSHISYFQTSGEWEEIEIPLKDMYPTFRGRRLNLPNFSAEYFEEVAFLIANKKEQDFKLTIDKIELK